MCSHVISLHGIKKYFSCMKRSYDMMLTSPYYSTLQQSSLLMKVVGILSTTSSGQHSFAFNERSVGHHHKSSGSSASTGRSTAAAANGSRNAATLGSTDGTVGRLSAEIIRRQASDPDSLGGSGIGCIHSDRSTPERRGNNEVHNSLLDTRELERAIMGEKKRLLRSGEYCRR